MPTGDSYYKIKQHIASTALECGRNPKEITLVAVSKQFSWGHISSAYNAGCREFGENKVQEALEKMSEAPDDIHWHLIGTLQKNKVRKVIGKFALIHSVDSIELAEKISLCSEGQGVKTRILLQVNTSGEATKHGYTIDEWREVFNEVRELSNVSVEGLMTLGPFTRDKGVIRRCFRGLREFRDELCENFEECELPHLSMGMTNDYPIAIEEGATLVRVGSAIFGERVKN